MLNGTYHQPTTIHFGKGAENKTGELAAKYARKVLLHYGAASFKKYGLYDRIVASLKAAGLEFIELGGVKSNPHATLVYKGVELCQNENVDFILAVGGGSVIDSAKAIAIGVPFHGDFFDIFEGKEKPQHAIPVATVLTIPGSGSESSPVSVITNEIKKIKLPYSNPLLAPVFSILNPEITVTLNQQQTAYGIVDAISHVLERYFTNTTFVDCTDRICEGLIKTLMKYALLVMDSPYDYDIRSEIMWACKLSHDDTAGFGRKQDWSSHRIAHEIGALYDVHHGALLGLIFPAWMQYVHKSHGSRFVQFAERVMDADISGDPENTAASAIAGFREFLLRIGMPSSLRELGIRDRTRFEEIAANCVRSMQSGTIGNFVRLSPQDITKILEIAY